MNESKRGKKRAAYAVVAACAMSAAAVALAHDDSFWVCARTRGFNDASDVLFASNILVRAAQAGMRYALVPIGLDTYWRWSEDRKARFLEVKRIADECGIGIVPDIWSTGYGAMTSIDPGLIESMPVEGLPYVARGGRLVPDKSGGQLVPDGGFEDAETLADLAAAGWLTSSMLAPAARDTGVARTGSASLRVDQRAVTKNEARISHRIALRPGSMYRASAWYRAEDLPAASGSLRLQVRIDAPGGGKGKPIVKTKTLNHYDNVKDTRWRKLVVDFHAGASTGAVVTCGSWNAKAGVFWIDDVSVEETGITEIARREGSPRTVRNADTGRVYSYGSDWQNPNFSRLKSGVDEISFPLPEGSAIKEGDRVRLDTYIPSRAGPKMQVSTCMSDPKLYELFRKSAETLEELLHPDKWYLSLDEIRNGGTCPLCSARKTDMAHILAGCVLRQHEIIRSVHPGADIYMTSDMLDPHQNAKEGPYYGCSGTFYGVWDLIPHDIIISLWWDKVIDKSVPFFTERGFRVMGSISIKANDDLDHVSKWKEVFDAHPGAMGFRYTTWAMNYDLMDEFVKKLRGQ